MTELLITIVTLLTAAVVIVPFFKRIGLGSILGYLAAGLVIGPYGFKLFTNSEAILHIAELGVVMFLFVIGLEMKPSHLWGLRKQIFGLGSLQIATATTFGTLVGVYLLGNSWQTAFVIAAGFVLTSTAIVMQTLSERGEMSAARGQKMISVLLFEDLLIVPLLAVISFLAPTDLQSIAEVQPIWQKILIGGGAIVFLIVAGSLLNPLFKILASTKLREIMTAAALLVVLGSALLMEESGLSSALGAFIAGVLLSESSFRHQLEADIEPFRGLLLGLFFLGVGMSLNLPLVAENWASILLGVSLLMSAKGLAIYLVARLTKASIFDALDRAVVMALGGEFAFVLFSAAASQKVITAQQEANGVAIIVISMVLTPLFIILFKRYVAPRFAHTDSRDDDHIDEQHPIILLGFGRFGQIVHDLITMTGHQVTTIDLDEKMIKLMKKMGQKGYYGNGMRPELLKIAGIEDARLLIVAIDDPEKTTHVVSIAHKINPNLTIMARAFDRIHVYQLFHAGANIQVRETFDSALRMGKDVLKELGINDDKVEEIGDLYFQKDRHAVRLGAEMYDPKSGRLNTDEFYKIVLEQDQELTRLIHEILDRED